MPEYELSDHVLDDTLTSLRDAPRWYVAFSGGVDSTVLLHLLQRWCKNRRLAPPLSAIHINHGLQSAAAEWQLHCESFCRTLGVPLHSFPASVSAAGRGVEAAARDARYGIFKRQLEAGDVLFLGHHLDDQVETFFLRLLRGAGLQGLAAMPLTRPLGAGRLARPLLGLPRRQLEAYAAEHGLTWVEDPSNEDTDLDRNFLRAQVLPLLASRWPGYRQTVSRAAEHIGDAAALLVELQPPPATVHSVMGDPGIALAELVADGPRGAAKLRHWLQARNLPAPDQAQMAEFLRQLREGGERSRPGLRCSAFTLQRYRDAVYLLPDFDRQSVGESLWLGPGEIYELPGWGQLALEEVAATGLSLAPGERLQVRWRRGGERCRPRGRPGGSASLKKLLQERGVPPWWRDRLPLLYLGDELLAVGGLWLCQSSRLADRAEPGRALWQPRWRRNIDAALD